MYLCYFSNEKQKDRFWELSEHRAVHLNNCFTDQRDLCVSVCGRMQHHAMCMLAEELTDLLANPIILSSDQSNKTVF